jgi:hypothetical protein
MTAFAGVFGGGRSTAGRARERRRQESKKAREVLFQELLLLEQQHQAGAIGPRTYEQARAVLLNAAGRLLAPKHADPHT